MGRVRKLLPGIITASLVAGCGGGGGGGAPTGTIEGTLVLEQSPPTQTATLTSVAPPRHEPNDWMFCATDLGGESSFRIEGDVGSTGDSRDLLRWQAPAGRFEIAFAGDRSVRCTAITCDTGTSRDAWHVLRHTYIELESATEIVFELSARTPAHYRLLARPADTPREASTPMTATATAALWTDITTLGGAELTDEVLVCTEHDLDAAVARRHDLSLVRRGGAVQLFRMRHRPQDVVAVADVLRDLRRACPDARYVSPNLRIPLTALAGHAIATPNDPLYATNQAHFRVTDFPAAWDITTGDDDLAIAVIDTGILAGHPDLAPRISDLGYDFISDATSAGDGDGQDSNPDEPQTLQAITLFHGTYVAGILGAVSDNGIGVAGATWRGKVIPIRAFGQLGTTTFDLVQSMRYLSGQTNSAGRVLGADERPVVVNMSYASFVATAAEKTEVENLASAGIHMAAAMGNDGLTPAPAIYPAAWPEVIGVAAVDRDLTRTAYSNAADYAEIAAVGGTEIAGPGGVTTTWGSRIGNRFEFVYNSFLGTSVATPSISGAIALMKSVHRSITDAELRRILAATATDRGATGRDAEYGHGVLQAGKAIAAAKLASPPSPDVSPSRYTFPDDQDRTSLSVVNRGGQSLGALRLSSTAPPSGAFTLSLTSLNAPSDIRVELDRSRVLVGRYVDRYLLESNAGSVPIELSFRKPIPAPPPEIEVRIYDGARLVASRMTGADGSFSVQSLPFGTYRFEAGVDLDKDGRLGDSQEWFLSRTIEVSGDRAAELNGVVIPWRN